MFLSPSRRYNLLFGLVFVLVLIFALHQTHRLRYSFISFLRSRPSKSMAVDYRVQARVDRVREICVEEDPFEREYGRMNLRMSRAYEGSCHRVRRLLRKSFRGEPLTIAAIGGSITKGHHVSGNEVWFSRFGEWLDDIVGHDVDVFRVNGAAPATGSDYFSFCFPLHIPDNSDLVLVELAVNDEGIPEHVENMENLLRGLLDMPNEPAVVLVEALAFSTGGMGGGGGRMHLPVAQYFDVPVINQRHPLANHFGRYPQLVRPYFTENFWGDPDTRHLNARGHRDLAMLIASFFRDVACEMLVEEDFSSGISEAVRESNVADVVEDLDVTAFEALLAEEQAAWPEQSRSWWAAGVKGEDVATLMPGMWTTPLEYGLLPRMRVTDGWNPDPAHSVRPFHPTCLSTRSNDPKFNLTSSTDSGWESWVHPDFLDKPYLVSRVPGSKASFEMATSLGVVKMYSLRSTTYGLGTVECWADDDRSRAVKVVGWWDNSELNIGRFVTIRADLSPGVHTITCELLDETSDPGGGHEFRMISMMSV